MEQVWESAIYTSQRRATNKKTVAHEQQKPSTFRPGSCRPSFSSPYYDEGRTNVEAHCEEAR